MRSACTDNRVPNGGPIPEPLLERCLAAGVPLMCDEPEGFSTFRLGLFGLDKLHNVDRTVEKLEATLNKIL